MTHTINFGCGLQADFDVEAGRAVIHTKQGTELAAVIRKNQAWWLEDCPNKQSFASLDEAAQTIYESLSQAAVLAIAVEAELL